MLLLDYSNPEPAEWFTADFIVDNPPFIGASRLRDVLGEGYVSVLLDLYKALDPVVAEAYGWHATLPEPEILMRLVHLNRIRAAERDEWSRSLPAPIY